MSSRGKMLLWLVALATGLASAAQALAASEGGHQVTLTVKKTGEGDPIATWVNGNGPSDVFLTTGVDYTFSGTCNCGDGVTLSSCEEINKTAGPSTPASFTHTFTNLSVANNDMWVKCTCSVPDPDQESQGSFSVVAMKLEKVGNTTIEFNNKCSENTTIKVTAVFKDGGLCATFNGVVEIAEDGTTIYNENGGTLPASVTLTNGTKTFVAKSLAGAKTPWTDPPDAAKIKSTNYSVYGGNSLEIPQWVDNDNPPNNRVDWCEEWTNAFLSTFQSAGGELELVADTVSSIGADTYTVCWGHTIWETRVVHFNPAAEIPTHKMRVNTANYLKSTVLHESRHAFVSWDTDRGVGVDHGAGPDNDDDPGGGAPGGGDYLPELTYHHTEATNGIRDHANPGHAKYHWWGDGTNDYVNAPPENPRDDQVDQAHEDDCWDFDLRYRNK